MSGRTRHLLVDTGGLVLARRVHPAGVTDREGAKALLAPLAGRVPRLGLVRVDGDDKGQCAGWVAAALGSRVEVVQRPDAGLRRVWLPADAPPPAPRPAGFRVRPRRWVVERTVAWLGRCRRLSTDDEAPPETEAAWIDLAMIGLMTRRLAR